MTRPESLFNVLILALSFILAVGLWYMITVRESLEAQTEVQLTYRGMPEHLMVYDGLLKSFNVHLRGPKALIKALEKKTLSYSVELSTLHRGTNIIPLAAPASLIGGRALDVTALVPNRLVLEAETVVERVVPLDLKFASSAVAQAIKAERLSAEPSDITVRGPESMVRKITDLKLEVPIDVEAGPGDHMLMLSVNVPQHVTSVPGTVRVSYVVSGKRSRLEVERTPYPDVRNTQHYQISPRKVRLQVELPESLVANKAYLDKIRVVVDVRAVLAGESRVVKPSVELPDGARLEGMVPNVLHVTNNEK